MIKTKKLHFEGTSYKTKRQIINCIHNSNNIIIGEFLLSWLSSNNNCTLTLPNANNGFLWFFILWPSMLFYSCCFSLCKILGSTNHVNLFMFCNLRKLSHISVDTMECTCSNEISKNGYLPSTESKF